MRRYIDIALYALMMGALLVVLGAATVRGTERVQRGGFSFPVHIVVQR